jgi:hypothetical protein
VLEYAVVNFRFSFLRKTRVVVAFALALWCAGTGCMLVSYAHGAALSADPDTSHAVNHKFAGLSASAGHNCCKARHSSSRKNPDAAAKQTPSAAEPSNGLAEITLPENPSPSGAMGCCPLTSGSFVVASRARAHDESGSVATNESTAFLSLTKSNAAPVSIPLRLPNQAQTYLRCCVFLI